MSELLAAQVTAVATAVLAVLAIVTAAFAVLAFRKQSAEVSILRQQAARDIDQRRREQAAHVFAWVDQRPCMTRTTSGQQPACGIRAGSRSTTST